MWTDGEKFQKTKKESKPILNKDNKIIKNIPLRAENTRNRDKIHPEKYQEFIEKRPMLVQTYQNPFLNKDFNEVIKDQHNFLTPKDSLIES